MATSRVAGVASQAVASGVSISSTTAKSAASALSVICTLTVASAGSSVKATCRSACQGIEVIWTEASPIATQGCGPGNNPPRANTAATIKGTAEARILKRSMLLSLADRSVNAAAYGWRSVNKTRYRRVDVAPGSPDGVNGSRECHQDVIAGLDPAIHLLRRTSCEA